MLKATLKQNTLPDDDQLISCETCLTSIPLSEYKVVEAEEYIAYFYGLDCYDVWVHQKQKPMNSPPR